MLNDELKEHPRYAEVMRELIFENLELNDAASLLNTDYEIMWAHVQDYMKFLSTKRPDAIQEAPLEYPDMLKSIIQKMYKKVDAAIDALDKDRPSAFIAQFRGCVQLLAELEGKMSTEPIMQLNLVTFKFDKLTSFLATRLPREYQQIVVEYLETIDKK